VKLYILVTEFGDVNTQHMTGFTTDEEVALAWQTKTNTFEQQAARDGFRGPSRFVLRTGGELPDQGPTATLTEPGSGAGVARIFAVEAEEIGLPKESGFPVWFFRDGENFWRTFKTGSLEEVKKELVNWALEKKLKEWTFTIESRARYQGGEKVPTLFMSIKE
jgi:hypothetical protein